MKIRILLSILLLVLATIVARPAVADLQQPLTIKTYQIEKIYGHKLGYRVDLIDDYGKLKVTYVKNDWLIDPEAKRNEVIGDFVLQQRIPSYMVVYYRSGKAVRFTIYALASTAKTLIVQAMDGEAANSDFDLSTLTVENQVSALPGDGSAVESRVASIG